jgi:hypothetical protein
MRNIILNAGLLIFFSLLLSCKKNFKELIPKPKLTMQDIAGEWHTTSEYSDNGVDFVRDTIIISDNRMKVFRHTGKPLPADNMDTTFISYGLVGFENDTLSISFLATRQKSLNFVLPIDMTPTKHKITLSPDRHILVISSFEKKRPGYAFSIFSRIK